MMLYIQNLKCYINYELNGKEYRIAKTINDIEAFNVKRSGIYISCFSPYNDKVEEFKVKCIPHVIDYMNRCSDTLNAMKKAIDDC